MNSTVRSNRKTKQKKNNSYNNFVDSFKKSKKFKNETLSKFNINENKSNAYSNFINSYKKTQQFENISKVDEIIKNSQSLMQYNPVKDSDEIQDKRINSLSSITNKLILYSGLAYLGYKYMQPVSTTERVGTYASTVGSTVGNYLLNRITWGMLGS